MDDGLLIAGVIGSIALLGGFIFLQKNAPNLLKVPAQWVAVAALPIVVVLFAGGYITKFSGFGIVLENTLNSPIVNTTQRDPISIVSSVRSDNKASVAELRALSKKEKLSTRYLRFVEGSSRYLDEAVTQYLQALPNLYFVEAGKFICLIPIEAFVTNDSNTAYDEDQIYIFVESLKYSTVVDDFSEYAITTSLTPDTDLLTVLKTMNTKNQKYVGINNVDGQYVGVAIKSEIEHLIASSVLAEQAKR
jgi:hypothetical protein